MSFSLQDFHSAAEAKYKGLVIEDGPNGPITLRSSIRLSDAETDKLQAAQEWIKIYQESDDEAARPSDLRAKMIDTLAILADKPRDLRNYLKGEDLGTVMVIFSAYQKETQGAEGN